jgi:hypothetical protein
LPFQLLDAQHQAQPVKPVGDGEALPGHAVCVQEELPFGPPLYQTFHDLQGREGEKNDPGPAFALRLLFRDDDRLPVELHLSGLDVAGLLRSTAAVPAEF